MNHPVIIKRNKFLNNNTYLNSIRRAIINEIPTYTFDNVIFNNFSSSIYNIDYIIQRLRLIPLIQDKLTKLVGQQFVCNVNNTTNKYLPVTPGNITTIDKKSVPFINENIRKNLPIIYLPPNESISFTCELKQGSETGYNKYCHAWFDDDNFYVESIDKCSNEKKAVKETIDYLINESERIKNIIFKKYNNKDQNIIKTEIKLENVSRSVLNLIAEETRNYYGYCIALIKDGKKIPSNWMSLIDPTDYVVSVVQPHLSENKYSILLDVNDKYIEYDANNKSPMNLYNIFYQLVVKKSNDNYPTVSNILVYILLFAIDKMISNLNEIKKNLN